MPKVTIDPWNNRLTIILHHWHRVDMPRYVEQIESACHTLLPGFACLALYRSNARMTRRDRELLLKTSDLISAYGAGCVIWVTPKLARRQLRHPSSGTLRIPIEVAPDIQTAENRLQSHPR